MTVGAAALRPPKWPGGAAARALVLRMDDGLMVRRRELVVMTVLEACLEGAAPPVAAGALRLTRRPRLPLGDGSTAAKRSDSVMGRREA